MSNFYEWILTMLPTIPAAAPTPTEPQTAAVSSTDEPNVDAIVCSVCDEGDKEDELLLCDGCQKAMHASCIGLHGVPHGDWFCKKCQKQGKTAIPVAPTPTTPVFVYVRVSSTGQDQPEFGRVGLMTQMHAIMQYCQRVGLLIRETFSDVGSARDVEHLVNYNKMIKKAYVESRRGTCILVYSVSRFARNVQQGRQNIAKLHQNDCYVFSVTENVSSYDSQFTVLLQQAQAMSDQLSQTMQDSLQRRRDLGQYIGTAPYGFERGANGQLRLRPSEARGLEIIVNNRAFIRDAIVKKLVEANIPARNGGEWTKGRVATILKHLNSRAFSNMVISANNQV